MLTIRDCISLQNVENLARLDVVTLLRPLLADTNSRCAEPISKTLGPGSCCGYGKKGLPAPSGYFLMTRVFADCASLML